MFALYSNHVVFLFCSRYARRRARIDGVATNATTAKSTTTTTTTTTTSKHVGKTRKAKRNVNDDRSDDCDDDDDDNDDGEDDSSRLSTSHSRQPHKKSKIPVSMLDDTDDDSESNIQDLLARDRLKVDAFFDPTNN